MHNSLDQRAHDIVVLAELIEKMLSNCTLPLKTDERVGAILAHIRNTAEDIRDALEDADIMQPDTFSLTIFAAEGPVTATTPEDALRMFQSPPAISKPHYTNNIIPFQRH